MSNKNSLHVMIKFCETTQALKQFNRRQKAIKYIKLYITMLLIMTLFHIIVSGIIDAQFVARF
jgi:hypothetical protein